MAKSGLYSVFLMISNRRNLQQVCNNLAFIFFVCGIECRGNLITFEQSSIAFSLSIYFVDSLWRQGISLL